MIDLERIDIDIDIDIITYMLLIWSDLLIFVVF